MGPLWAELILYLGTSGNETWPVSAVAVCGRREVYQTIRESICYHGNTKHQLPLLTMATDYIRYHGNEVYDRI